MPQLWWCPQPCCSPGPAMHRFCMCTKLHVACISQRDGCGKAPPGRMCPSMPLTPLQRLGLWLLKECLLYQNDCIFLRRCHQCCRSSSWVLQPTSASYRSHGVGNKERYWPQLGQQAGKLPFRRRKARVGDGFHRAETPLRGALRSKAKDKTHLLESHACLNTQTSSVSIFLVYMTLFGERRTLPTEHRDTVI